MQLQFGFLPPSFDCPYRHFQSGGRFLLAQTFIEQEIDDFLLLLGQLIHMLMELTPHADVVWFIGGGMK